MFRFLGNLIGGILGFLGKLFGGILGFIGKLFGAILGFPAKLLGFGKKGEKAAAEKAEPKATSSKSAGFFLEADEARGFTSSNGKSAPSVKSEPAKPVASALNLPAPKVVNTAEANPYIQFARRRPGANMSSFLAMAKQVRPSG